MPMTIDEHIKYEQEALQARHTEWVGMVRRCMSEGTYETVPLLYRAMALALPTVEGKVRELTETHQRGRGGAYRAMLREVGEAEVACLGMSVMVEVALGGGTLASACKAIGKAILAEYNFKRAYRVNPMYCQIIQQQLVDRKTKSIDHAYRTIKASLENMGIPPASLPAPTVISIGGLLLDALEATGLFAFTMQSVGKGRPVHVVSLHPEVAASIEDALDRVNPHKASPVLLLPPVPLNPKGVGGMYYSPEMGINYLACTGMRSADYRALNLDVSCVMAGLDKLSATPFRINGAAVELLSSVIASGGFGLPTPPQMPPVPPFLVGVVNLAAFIKEAQSRGDTELVQDCTWYRDSIRRYHEKMKKYKASINSVYRALRDAQQVKHEDAIYLPTYADTRGRLYYHSNLNPQGIDCQKAMLELAEAKPLGKEGVYWLKVHIANCFGFDKVALDLRAKYVDDMLHRLQEAVIIPVMHTDFWEQADSPMCAYVAALELVNAINTGNPETYLSRCITQWDATCSGSQHFSALMRDSVGGTWTNLIDHPGCKADIYTKVAEVVLEHCREDLKDPDCKDLIEAKFWVECGIPRALAKKPVMTLVYGATLVGMAGDVCDYLHENAIQIPEGYSSRRLGLYLASRFVKGMTEVLPAVVECMQWLRALARKAASEGKHVVWTTPTGTQVVNWYGKETVTKRELGVYKTRNIRVYNKTKVPDSNKVANGISPNFVHSLDASHLLKTLDECHARGIRFVSVHDSFGTHAADAGQLHTILRMEFVKMYNNCHVLEEMAEEYDMPMLPTGNLNINNVLESQFFFC